MSTPTGKPQWARGEKAAHVGRAVYYFPDRAAFRWQARPERLFVRLDGVVYVYSEAGEVSIPEETRHALAARWGKDGPFSRWEQHLSIVPVPKTDDA